MCIVKKTVCGDLTLSESRFFYIIKVGVEEKLLKNVISNHHCREPFEKMDHMIII